MSNVTPPDRGDGTLHAETPADEERSVATAPPSGLSDDPLSMVTMVVGVVVTLAIVGLLVWLIASTGGVLRQAHWVVLYTGLAFATGTLFWSLTRSSGVVTLPQLGVKLGGGAAVGVGTVLVINWIVPSEFHRFQVCDLSPELVSEDTPLKITGASPKNLAVQLLDDGRVVVEFAANTLERHFTTEQFLRKEQAFRRVDYIVTYTGHVTAKERTQQ